MAFQSGARDETNFHLHFGRCLCGKAAIESGVSLGAHLDDPDAETAHESLCSVAVDAEAQLEVASGKLCYFGTFECGKGWLPISNPRLVSTDEQKSVVSVLAVLAFARSRSLQVRFEL